MKQFLGITLLLVSASVLIAGCSKKGRHTIKVNDKSDIHTVHKKQQVRKNAEQGALIGTGVGAGILTGLGISTAASSTVIASLYALPAVIVVGGVIGTGVGLYKAHQKKCCYKNLKKELSKENINDNNHQVIEVVEVT